MGGWMLTVAVVFLIYALIMKSNRLKRPRRSPKLSPPIWADGATKQLFKQFNQAWTNEIEKVVNERYRIQDGSLPPYEIQARWYELKKFLLLASFSKGLPMFSQKVDDIWHLFLEEDTLYQKFCTEFIGERIEHHPHGQPKHLPAERAWFDILYLSFFPISDYSHLWGDFLQEREEHERWMQQIRSQSAQLKSELGKLRAAAPTLETMDAFLTFAEDLMERKDDKLTQRVQQPEGYWYGAALFGVGTYGAIEIEERKSKHDGYNGDGIGYAGSADQDKQQNENWYDLASDVNEYQSGSNATTQSTHSGGGCSSCSSCSSCSGCSS
ncbi:hypothetical protein [Sporosarcina cyprini]|uniref:hypothetical protein n=1 Tax=Sporosarcina cyprini TaxID=2910523 RepID=UPI001EDCD81B|nr:hypothetical protein [Sporosarcina cyprini]MCG3088940.1 hypothetical protein [Sporosarcina cyprini]